MKLPYPIPPGTVLVASAVVASWLLFFAGGAWLGYAAMRDYYHSELPFPANYRGHTT